MEEKSLRFRNPREDKLEHLAEKKPDPFFESSDLFLCAYLKAKGVIFEGTKHGAGKRIVFVFQHQSHLEGLVKSYLNDGLVPVLSLKAALRNLRDLIFEESRR